MLDIVEQTIDSQFLRPSLRPFSLRLTADVIADTPTPLPPVASLMFTVLEHWLAKCFSPLQSKRRVQFCGERRTLFLLLFLASKGRRSSLVRIERHSCDRISFVLSHDPKQVLDGRTAFYIHA